MIYKCRVINIQSKRDVWNGRREMFFISKVSLLSTYKINEREREREENFFPSDFYHLHLNFGYSRIEVSGYPLLSYVFRAFGDGE